MKKNKLIKNIKESYNHIPYTWKHYLAFLKTEKKYLGKYKYKFHDWDKLVMYIFMPFLGTEKISKIHQRYSPHHPRYDKRFIKDPRKINWEEAIIDWECAALTKPDKPLNARGTMKKFYPECKKWCLPVLEELGL